MKDGGLEGLFVIRMGYRFIPIWRMDWRLGYYRLSRCIEDSLHERPFVKLDRPSFHSPCMSSSNHMERDCALRRCSTVSIAVVMYVKDLMSQSIHGNDGTVRGFSA